MAMRVGTILRQEYGRRVTILLSLAVLAGAVGWGFYRMNLIGSYAVDDPYITYRYARNLAQGRGLTYNPGEHVLSTTAPFYAVILALGARLGADIPTLSNALSALSFWAIGAAVLLLAARHGQLLTGACAAIVCVTSPLLWLTTGFETGFCIALIAWAFWAFDADGNYPAGRLAWSLALLALAAITRNDAVVAVGVIGLLWWAKHRRLRSFPWRSLIAPVAIVLLFGLWLTVQFGSPLPVTLTAKAAQARFGLTGFYPRTSFPLGGIILFQAWSGQTWLYWLALPLILLGLWGLRRARWAWGAFGWGALMMAAYAALDIAPYAWYYAPLALPIALLAGIGVEAAGRAWWRRGGAVLAAGLLVTAQAISLARMAQPTLAARFSPDSVQTKVLQEPKCAVYRRVGEWLNQNTPPEATVGVVEVGVMGYYADRPMVDFLGLLQPEVARALSRGDIFWAMPHYALDYVVLTAVNPLYSYPIWKDPWFEAAYAPVQTFQDPDFWGAPITIYRRQGGYTPVVAHPVGRPLLDGVTLIEWGADGGRRNEFGDSSGRPFDSAHGRPFDSAHGRPFDSAHGRLLEPGQPLRLRLTWQLADPALLEGANVSVYLVDLDWFEVGQRAIRYSTAAWPAGERVEVYHPLLLKDQIPPGRYGVRVRIEDAGGAGRFDGEVGWLKRPPLVEGNPPVVPAGGRTAFAHLIGYTVQPEDLQIGQPLTVTLYWAAQGGAERDWTVFVQLVGEADKVHPAGQLIAQADGQPVGGRYPTTVWDQGEVIQDVHVTPPLQAPLPAGPYAVLVGWYDLQSGERAALVDENGQPLAGHAARLEVSH